MESGHAFVLTPLVIFFLYSILLFYFWCKSHFISGGYLHGVTSLTYGVDIEKIRWMGILQVWSYLVQSFLATVHIKMIGNCTLYKDVIVSQKNFTGKLVHNNSANEAT